MLLGSSLLAWPISTGYQGHPPASYPHAFGAEKFHLAVIVSSLQIAAGTDDPPPGQTFGLAQDVPHRPGSTRVSGFFGDFAVSDHISRLQGVEHPKNLVLESGHRVPKSRSPMSPRPGRM